MSLAFPEAYEFVERHRDHLGVSDPDGYVARLRAFMDETSEDARAAATIAADAAKSLINIAVVFFAALGAFALAYLSTHATFGFAIPVVLLAASALGTIASMVAGFAAIGRTYQSQREAAAGLPQATRPLSRWFRVQPLMGLGALVLFAVSLFFWDAGSSPTADARTDQLQSRVDALQNLQGRVDALQNLQSRIDALQTRLDQQAADLAKAIQAPTASHTANAVPPLNFVGLTQVPPKLDAIVEALRELKATIPPPSPPPEPVVVAQPSPPPPATVLPAPASVAPQPPSPPPATAVPAPASVAPPPSRLEADLSRADWTKIQEALSARGFPPGKIDGLPRRKTREAIRTYQAKLHAPEDGRLTSQQIDDLLGTH